MEKNSSNPADSQEEGKAAKQGRGEAARTAGQQIKASQPDVSAEKEQSPQPAGPWELRSARAAETALGQDCQGNCK